MKYLIYERLGSIGLIKISRAEVLNALNRELLEEFYMLLELLNKGQQLRALILTGDGDKSFASGADISEMQQMGHLESLRFFELGQKVADELQKASFLTIAAVNGYALGGGFELALACDFIYATPNSTFGFPEVTLGLIPAFGGTQRLTEAVGSRSAKELIMTGKTLSGQEAFDLKIVNKVCSHDSLLPSCYETANLILKNPINAIVQAKKAINMASHLDAQSFEAERNMAAVCFATGERESHMEAFLQQKGHHAAR